MENGKETLEKEIKSENVSANELKQLLEKLLSFVSKKDIKNPPPPPPPGEDPVVRVLLTANIMVLTALTYLLIRRHR